eukprot:COSAG02_NODE_567_length_20212_cov_18.927460_6_plen_124_part_00
MRGTVLSRGSKWPEWPLVRLDDGDVCLLQCNRNNYLGNNRDEGCWRIVDDAYPAILTEQTTASCEPDDLENKQAQKQRLDKQPSSLEIGSAESTAVQKDPIVRTMLCSQPNCAVAFTWFLSSV